MAIDVQTVVKYGQDFVYTMSVTGAELLEALENSVSLINTGRFVQVGRRSFFLAQLLPVRTELTAHAHAQPPPHTHTQISGLKFSWNSNQDVGWRVVNAWSIDSEGRAELINNNTRYSLSMLDFMAKGGDGYTIFSTNGSNVVNFGYTLNQVILQHLGAEIAMPGIAPRIVSSSAVKRNCLAEDGSLCNNNGLCVSGACQCDPGTAGSSHGLSRSCVRACALWFAIDLVRVTTCRQARIAARSAPPARATTRPRSCWAWCCLSSFSCSFWPSSAPSSCGAT
jgi:hypothetical protein